MRRREKRKTARENQEETRTVRIADSEGNILGFNFAPSGSWSLPAGFMAGTLRALPFQKTLVGAATWAEGVGPDPRLRSALRRLLEELESFT